MKNPLLLTPGPTPVPEDVLEAMARPMIHHRHEPFRAVLAQVAQDLKYLFQTKNEVLLFSSSGTGAMEGAVSNLLSKGLRMSDFEESVNILSQNVNKLVIAMDTCHAGSLAVNVRSGTGGENLAAVLKESTGIYILSAAKSGEVSVEGKRFKLHDQDPGHGVFTYALIEGMMGKANYNGDEYVSLNELFQFVAKQVPRLTQGRQHPFFRSAGTDLPLVVME